MPDTMNPPTPTVYVVQGLHQSIPGQITRVYASDTAAHTEAASILNIMLADAGMAANATRINWEQRLACLQEEHADGDNAHVAVIPCAILD